MKNHFRIFSLVLVVLTIACIVPTVYSSAVGTTEVSCLINPDDTSKVDVKIEVGVEVSTDDNKLYLFAVPTYVDSVVGHIPIASVEYDGNGLYSFQVDLNIDSSESILYSKFFVGVLSSGSYRSIASGHFITNPEVVATSNLPRTETASKKGIHIMPSIPTDLEELHVKQGYFNIVLSVLLSNSPTDIAYTYNGKTYYFNSVIGEYDYLISNMTKNGTAVTLSLLNKYTPGYEYLLCPGVTYREGTQFYAFNSSTEQGMETLAAVSHFLAERYNGANEAYGKVDNWIVGNEVNDNLLYYYMGEQDVDTFVQEYLQSFRVIYTGVKSAYANANVYICLEHRWTTEDSTSDYGGKHFVDSFNMYAKEQGDIDWGLSFHPYSYPMNDPDILNDGQPSVDAYGNSTFGGEVTNTVSTPLITMKNLHVLTDYFHNKELLNPDGEVRSIILGEQGYTSNSNITGKNEAKQAANIALAYYIAEMNEDVDAFLLRSHCDESEGSEYYKFGLREMDSDGNPSMQKYSYEMYKYIDTTASLQYTEFAKETLNIGDWADVVRNWQPEKFMSMGTVTEDVLYTVSDCSGTVLAKEMLNQWEPGYNVFEIGVFDYEPLHYPDGVAVVNSFASCMNYQGIEKHFENPLSVDAYLTLKANFKPMESSNAEDKLEVKIRLHSGNDTYDAAGIVALNKNYMLCLDLRQWDGRHSVDTIEVLVRSHAQKESFAGTFTVYELTNATMAKQLNQLENIETEYIDISGAEVIYQKSFNYTGGAIEPTVAVKLGDKVLKQHEDYDLVYHDNVKTGQAKIVVVGIGKYRGVQSKQFTIQNDFPTVYNNVDYSAVYAYSYYLENNPVVEKEVGTDPQAVLEHFVTKGMPYALQGISDFNVLAYAKINSDLQDEFGSDWPAYYLHYLDRGIKEGRSTSGIKPDDMEVPVYPGNETEEDIPGGTVVITPAPSNGETTAMYRLYNPNSGEHFYTGSADEGNMLVKAGWQYEGIAWNAPIKNGDPVYRLYNPNSGDHHYTMSAEERDMLVGVGWQYEGVAWNSASSDNLPLFRLYNPNADCGSHHYTGSAEERDFLVSVGWIYEGIGWFGLVK